jgi:hypothetical protein
MTIDNLDVRITIQIWIDYPDGTITIQITSSKYKMHPKIVYTTVLPIWIYNLSGNITTNPDIR